MPSGSGDDTGVPRGFAATMLGVTPHTISMWVKDGWHDADGNHHTVHVVTVTAKQRYYRWGDLVKAEADTRNNPNSRRGVVYTPRPATGPESWAAISRRKSPRVFGSQNASAGDTADRQAGNPRRVLRPVEPARSGVQRHASQQRTKQANA